MARFSRGDAWHETVLTWLQHDNQVQLVTNWPVCNEVCAPLAQPISSPEALDFLRSAVRGGITIDASDGHTLAEVLSISERLQDLPSDLADASIAETAARLKVHFVLTIDSDFDVYRDKTGKPLVNVLF
jgi:uncharacterized protein